MADGVHSRREKRPSAVGPIPGQTSEAEVGTEEEVSEGVFLRVAVEVGAVVDLDEGWMT